MQIRELPLVEYRNSIAGNFGEVYGLTFGELGQDGLNACVCVAKRSNKNVTSGMWSRNRGNFVLSFMFQT